MPDDGPDARRASSTTRSSSPPSRPSTTGRASTRTRAAMICYTSGTTGNPQGRRLQPPLDRAARARRVPGRHDSASRSATRSCRSCRCSTRTPGGLPHAAAARRREARLPGAEARSGEPARPDGAREGHPRRRRADDLARHPRAARREPEEVGPLAHAADDGRRLGGAARDDRRLREAPRPRRHARVGHDRDQPARHASRA